ncbi:cell division protein [Aliivibrio finisterrensis]|uniref:SPOR domain-containing protein n=1 Tax=Aliivibrio finisterrensis TaxID=511998 RepID=UPI001020BD87|nr:SPOR domain-containing protein [Aliivibrio finisterrensis]RYU69943.1 cell division protein [Aliivibrio finisterrensis]RYU73732.1 cell division protein [Aliivibrio finisterrensis]RYU76575.1 cell division protein [Aliivibrio finisterrensis]
MSIGHDLTVLELESQLDVLSRIQFVSRFGSNLVHIEGVKGSGKSWLAQRYLEKWCDDANQALLMCHSNQSIQQQRGIILKQVVRDPLFNESDTVVDSIDRMLAGEKCNLVLVIDDAHLLSSELLSELWLLVQKAQSTPNWQINVLLFSESGKLAPELTRMSYGQDNKPVDIDIEPLTAEEAVTFAEMLVVRFAPSREDKIRIRNLVDKSNNLPAELIALGDKKAERRIIIRSVTHSPVGILGLASLLLLGAAGTYWWLNSQSSELPVIETLVDGDGPLVVTLDDKLNAELVQVNDDELQSNSLPEDDTGSIPPEVIDTPIVIDSKVEEGKRVVVPSELVDSLVNDNDEVIEPKIEKTIESSNIAQTETETETETDEATKSTVAIVEEDKSQISQSDAPKSEEAKATFVIADKELKAISDKRYILQLAALTNETAVQEFLNEHQIEGSARIYQTLRNGSIWYIVTFGDYESISAARGAVQNLPSSVQSLGPWVKSLVQVHREIDSVK